MDEKLTSVNVEPLPTPVPYSTGNGRCTSSFGCGKKKSSAMEN